jgi:uncharacterized membrane protein
MVRFKRWFRHAFLPPWRWQLLFSKNVLTAIEVAVRQSEAHHRGEIRFAIENALPPSRVWHGVSAWHRATEVFSNLRIWDTEDNCGVLIYVLVADRQVHIVADRGIHKHVQQAEWDAIASTMSKHYIQGDFQRGSIEGIAQITALLSDKFPATGDKLINELPDRPVIIRR